MWENLGIIYNVLLSVLYLLVKDKCNILTYLNDWCWLTDEQYTDYTDMTEQNQGTKRILRFKCSFIK